MATEILRLHIKLTQSHSVSDGRRSAALVLFEGMAKSELFSGTILSGAVDTQLTDENGLISLSARYILDGTDASGAKCRIFIDNSLSAGEKYSSPTLITDSPVLVKYERVPLKGEIVPSKDGITIIISEK